MWLTEMFVNLQQQLPLSSAEAGQWTSTRTKVCSFLWQDTNIYFLFTLHNRASTNKSSIFILPIAPPTCVDTYHTTHCSYESINPLAPFSKSNIPLHTSRLQTRRNGLRTNQLRPLSGITKENRIGSYKSQSDKLVSTNFTRIVRFLGPKVGWAVWK